MIDNNTFIEETGTDWFNNLLSSESLELENQPPSFSLELEEETLEFSTLTDRLIKLEQDNGLSSLAVFRQYFLGELEGNRDLERWLDLFLLYLGTEEVRRFACP